MTFFHAPLVNAYQNLSNVMLRIQPRGWQSAVNDTLLLNAHYDSPIGSTGNAATTVWSRRWATSHKHQRLLDWMERGSNPDTSAPTRVVGAVRTCGYTSFSRPVGDGCSQPQLHMMPFTGSALFCRPVKLVQQKCSPKGKEEACVEDCISVAHTSSIKLRPPADAPH